MMYLLDTDVVIWLLRGRLELANKIKVLNESASMCLSVITIAEIYMNVFPSEITTTEDLIEEHIVFDVDTQIAKAAGFYWQDYSKQLKQLSLTDCLIAATARVRDCKLLTLNTKHFPMKDIKIIDPLR